MKLDWDMLTDQDFEELCYDLLDKDGFENLKWLGHSGSDRGRDITCSKNQRILGNIERKTIYHVQCKRYVARPPHPSDLSDTIAWADAHKPHVLLIMVSNTLTAPTHDWLFKVGEGKPYQILVYEEKHFERFLEKNRDLYKRHFEGKERKPLPEITTDETQNRVLMCLVDESRKTVEKISREVNEPVSKIEPVIEDLLLKGILTRSKVKTDGAVAKHSLENDFAAFVDVARMLLPTDHRFDFLTSSFSRDMIEKNLAKHIESRYYLKLSTQHEKGIVMILKTSPSALYYSLFSDNRSYETGFHHLQSLEITDEIRRKWADSYVNSFVSNLLEKILVDLHHPDSKKALQKNKIDSYKLSIGVKMANIEEPIMDLSSESVIMLLKAQGAIRAGALVSSTTPELHITIGGILMNLGLLEEAIRQYDLAIEQIQNEENLKVVWNNKGVCLMRLSKIPEALCCFDKALSIDPNLKEAQKNKQKCLDFMESQV